MIEKFSSTNELLPHEWEHIKQRLGEAALNGIRRIEYPHSDNPHATFGSRVTLLEDSEELQYDLVTSHVDGIDPFDSEVVLVTPTSPLGQRLHGLLEGSNVTWNSPGGTVSARVLKVDQNAQRKSYEEGMVIEADEAS